MYWHDCNKEPPTPEVEYEVLVLDHDIYHGTSVASVAIACHEAGHAVQHAEQYSFIALRNKMLPMVNISNKFSWILIFLGLLLSMANLFMMARRCS